MKIVLGTLLPKYPGLVLEFSAEGRQINRCLNMISVSQLMSLVNTIGQS